MSCAGMCQKPAGPHTCVSPPLQHSRLPAPSFNQTKYLHLRDLLLLLDCSCDDLESEITSEPKQRGPFLKHFLNLLLLLPCCIIDLISPRLLTGNTVTILSLCTIICCESLKWAWWRLKEVRDCGLMKPTEQHHLQKDPILKPPNNFLFIDFRESASVGWPTWSPVNTCGHWCLRSLDSFSYCLRLYGKRLPVIENWWFCPAGI